MSKDIIKRQSLTILKEKKVKVEDIQINYAEAGSGKTIICIHGWTNNWRGFVPMSQYLVKKFRIMAIDLPGFGDSGRLPNYDLEIEAGYVKKFMDTLKIEKPIIVGHSMGAYVASKFYNMYPDTAEKIVLISPMFKKKNKERMMRLVEIFYRTVRKTNITQWLLKKLVDGEKYTYITAKYVNMYHYNKETVENFGQEGRRKASKEAYIDMGVEVAKTNIDDLIAGNKLPIDMIFGKYDKLTNAEQARKILEGRGKYNIAEVDEAGHILTVEQPKLTAEALMDLIGKDKLPAGNVG